MTQESITSTALKLLGILTIAMLGSTFWETPKYYCESRPDIGLHECDSFSKYVHPYGKCVKDDAPNLICRTGWVQVANDITLDPPVNQNSRTDKEVQYECNHKGCERIL